MMTDRTRTVALLFALILSAVGAHAADPGPKAGFRDLKWGDPPSADMVIVRLPRPPGSLPMDLYWRADEFGKGNHPIVAGHRTSDVSYYFYKNRFCRVQIVWNEIRRRDLDQIGTNLSVAWGKDDGRNTRGERVWTSRDGVTVAALQHDGSENSATLTLTEGACTRRAATEAAGVGSR